MDKMDGPPIGTTSPKSMTGNYPKYAETPMTYSEEEEEEPKTSLFYNAYHIAFIAMVITLVWSVLTIRADMNIVLAYQKEHVQQYSYILKLLQGMKQVQWQIVPALNPTP